MISGDKINVATSILSKLHHGDSVYIIDEKTETTLKCHIEYDDGHEVNFMIEGNADLEAYMVFFNNGPSVLRYFMDEAINSSIDRNNLLKAFQVTFDSLMEENKQLKQKIIELDGEFDV